MTPTDPRQRHVKVHDDNEICHCMYRPLRLYGHLNMAREITPVLVRRLN
jgi:hypothetical protein